MNNINEKYTFVENKDSEWQGIGLTEKAGKYQGVVYKYGEVSIAEEENEDGSLNISFEWEILDSNGLPKEAFQEDFFKLIGKILEQIVEESLERGDYKYENRDNNTVTINSQ